MLDLPMWLLRHIEKDNFKCPSCSVKFLKGGINIVGIKKAHRDDCKSVLFLEYKCHNCQEITMIELYEMSVLEFASEILSDLEDQSYVGMKQEKYNSSVNRKRTGRRKARKRTSPKSKITKDEIKEVIGMIKKCDTWIDWLGEIGAPMRYATPDDEKHIGRFYISDIGEKETNNE